MAGVTCTWLGFYFTRLASNRFANSKALNAG